MKKQAAVAVPQVSSLSVFEAEDRRMKGDFASLEEGISIDAVIRFLKSWKTTFHDLSRQVKMFEKELKDRDDELHHLRSENERLSNEVNNAQSDYRTVNDDYKTLIQIMDRARKLAFLAEAEDEQKAKFKMDENGNLERIE